MSHLHYKCLATYPFFALLAGIFSPLLKFISNSALLVRHFSSQYCLDLYLWRTYVLCLIYLTEDLNPVIKIHTAYIKMRASFPRNRAAGRSLKSVDAKTRTSFLCERAAGWSLKSSLDVGLGYGWSLLDADLGYVSYAKSVRMVQKEKIRFVYLRVTAVAFWRTLRWSFRLLVFCFSSFFFHFSWWH